MYVCMYEFVCVCVRECVCVSSLFVSFFRVNQNKYDCRVIILPADAVCVSLLDLLLMFLGEHSMHVGSVCRAQVTLDTIGFRVRNPSAGCLKDDVIFVDTPGLADAQGNDSEHIAAMIKYLQARGCVFVWRQHLVEKREMAWHGMA
jgi:hypothetical protein